MVLLVTQFPKPIITEHWEDLPPARPKEAGPAAKGSLEMGQTLAGGRGVAEGVTSAPPPVVGDTRGLWPTLVFFTDFLSRNHGVGRHMGEDRP